jgi:hypothetical protein
MSSDYTADGLQVVLSIPVDGQGIVISPES